MPLFDTKTLDNDTDGLALLASVLYATPQAKADAMARGRERLARVGSFCQTLEPAVSAAGESRASLPAAHLA